MRVGTLPRGAPLAPCSCLGHFCGLQGTWVYHTAQENTLPGISLCQPLGVAGLGRSPARISSAPSTPTCPLAQQERAHSLWGSEEQKRTLCPPRAASGDACYSLACGLHLLSCSFFSLDWHLLWVSAWHGDRYLTPGHHPAPHPQACALVAGQTRAQQCPLLTAAPAVPLPHCPARCTPWWALHEWGHLRPLAMALCVSCSCLRVPPMIDAYLWASH